MIIATTTVNFAYLTGVWLETYERFKAVVKCGDYIAVVVPALDAERVGGRVYSYRDGEDPAVVLKDAARGCESQVVYVDGGTTLRHFEIIKRAFPGAELRLADDLFRQMRAIKREEEVEKIKRAVEEIRRVLEALELAPGVSEREAAFFIYKALYEAGLEPGPILVQFGQNTSLPHQEPTGKKLQRGEAVVLDVTASYRGYFGDLTKSFYYGEPPAHYAEVYRLVEEAQLSALKAARPGALASDVDKAARSVIETRGYGRYFIHRTGHGLGLELHEAPDISPGSGDLLQPGMVFTIEPGVYIPGKYGVRLEIDVVVREKGAEIL
ncbi:xaa-Pro dipeptidase, putative [Pyrobaculum aerophilum str. IM2]|uniref:Xaa-Pro dipeptidase, putative n=2 Tax=Pyrobaculum aerophilum TaxID=13773 RepID=Q8ZW13_PYRAE|nr:MULTISPECIES: Xaa-Pro peptidase family protein [Pyrobaculum]AAL63891.1 xaa-Pro dipeptidase, putative [Pyrobaculum aerophilum str. IM2]HII46543.1 aminopeptidase P family protein [Pyrobaculum aerophilum]